MLKVLHTADWHLGKRLELSERTEEHQYFLDWLIEKINRESIDVLIVCGDIFDTGSPSNTAFKQYYSFLRRVKDTCCNEVVIIGGNHDSVSTLNAPKDLLKHFNVHVIGGVPDIFEEQIITIEKEGLPQLVVCAVPFLRDKDVRLSVTGETAPEMEDRLIKGICGHYEKLVEHIKPYKANLIPVLATGHLFAQGASVSDSEQQIHVGNLAQIGGNQFPTEFDYVALGHLHRPQMVNGMNHIRYSGSPIPLSFSESEDEKKVVVLTFDGEQLAKLEEHSIPLTRKLLRISGNLQQVKETLQTIVDQQLQLSSWVEIQVFTTAIIPDLEEQLAEIIKEKPFVDRLFLKQVKEKLPTEILDIGEETMTLFDLTPKIVFQKRCQGERSNEEWSELEKTFDLAIELMYQKDNADLISEH